MSEAPSVISRVFVGVGNALKKVPEGQDQWIHGKIDRYIVPKLSPAQKEWYGKIAPRLKKSHAFGYVSTTLEAVTVAVIAKKGVEWFKKQHVPETHDIPAVVPSVMPVDRPEVSQPPSVAESVPWPWQCTTDPRALLDRELSVPILRAEGSQSIVMPYPGDSRKVVIANGPMGHEQGEKMENREFMRVLFAGNDRIHIPRVYDRNFRGLGEVVMERADGYTVASELFQEGFVQGPNEGFFAVPARKRLDALHALTNALDKLHANNRRIGDFNGYTITPEGQLWMLDMSLIKESTLSPDLLWKTDLFNPSPNSSRAPQNAFPAFLTRYLPVWDHNLPPVFTHLMSNMNTYPTAGAFENAISSYKLTPLRPADGATGRIDLSHIRRSGFGDAFASFDFQDHATGIWEDVVRMVQDMGSKKERDMESLNRMAKNLRLSSLEMLWMDLKAKELGLTK